MVKQRTLKSVVSVIGVALHSGERVTLTLRPAPVNTGIAFRRVDKDEKILIHANAHSVVDTTLATTLANKDHPEIRVSTVEHLLSAFAGLGITNALVDITAAEIPIMDGSSTSFVFLIQRAGIKEQEALMKFIKIKSKVMVTEKDKWACLEPYDGFKMSVGLDYDHPAIHKKLQNLTIDFSKSSYVKEISRARTYGFLKEVEYLKSKNLAKGGTLENAIVLDDYRVLNDNLRYDDELVRHKILDAIGDIYLLGYPIIGSFSGFKSGHALNNKLLRSLLATESSWEIVTFSERAKAPSTLFSMQLAFER